MCFTARMGKCLSGLLSVVCENLHKKLIIATSKYCDYHDYCPGAQNEKRPYMK